MNIQFETLKLSNFLSLGSVEVDLRERGFVLVEGINNNVTDNAKSNGSGKSSLFEGIVWILTGDTIRGTKDVVNKAVGKSTCGELEFTIDNNKYKIIRYREDLVYGNGLKVFFNGEDVSGKGVRDSSKILEQYLPDLNAQLLGSVIVLGQGLPQRFTNNTPGGRKEILEQLSKSDYMIEDIKNKLSLRRVDVNTDLRSVKDSIIANNTKVSVNQSRIDERKRDIENLPDVATYELKIQENEREIEDRNALIEDITVKEAAKRQEIDSLSAEIEKQLKVLADDERNDLEPINNEISDIQQKVRVEEYKQSDISKKIRDANNVQTECPYCRRPFDDVHKIDTTEWEKELEASKVEKNELSMLLESKIRDKRAIQDKYVDKRNQVNLLSSQRNNLQDELSKLTRHLPTLQSQVKDYQLSVVKLKQEISTLETKKVTYGNEITECFRVIEATTAETYELTIKQNELERRVDSLNKLVNIASKDFRTYLLESVIDYINLRVKHYSSRLFNSDLADFKSDGNQIWIGYAGKQYENLSGGEKQKLDIIVQFALRDMLMKILNFSCNMLVLDEVFDNLDEVGCDNLIDLITSELKDIESVYIITHHSDISVPYDDKIQIVKNSEGISNIE